MTTDALLTTGERTHRVLGTAGPAPARLGRSPRC